MVALVHPMSDPLCLFESRAFNVSFYPLLFQLQYHSLAEITIAWKTIKPKLVPAFWTLIWLENSVVLVTELIWRLGALGARLQSLERF